LNLFLKHLFANTFIITKKEGKLIPGADLMSVYAINGCHRHRHQRRSLTALTHASDCNSCFGRCILGDCDMLSLMLAIYGFFRGLGAEHYQELYKNVFVWLMQDEADTNIRNTLQKVIFDVQ
jgi:hypothetical protein